MTDKIRYVRRTNKLFDLPEELIIEIFRTRHEMLRFALFDDLRRHLRMRHATCYNCETALTEFYYECRCCVDNNLPGGLCETCYNEIGNYTYITP